MGEKTPKPTSIKERKRLLSTGQILGSDLVWFQQQRLSRVTRRPLGLLSPAYRTALFKPGLPPRAFPVASFIFCLQHKWRLTTVFWWGGRLPILFPHFLDHGEEGARSTCFPPPYLPRVERFQRKMTSHDLSDLRCWLQTDVSETSLLRKVGF